ncbi:MAG: hypothetical protein WAM97_17855 [Acidimicrobiales bacterium]
MAESLEYFEHVAVQPTSDLLILLLGPGTHPDTGDDTVLVPAGSAVEVRTRFVPGHWACGYEVAETLAHGYRIRRQGSHDVLYGVFDVKDVRVASDALDRAGSPARTDQVGMKNADTKISEDEPRTPGDTWLDRLEGTDFASIVEANPLLRMAKGVADAAIKVPPVGAMARPLSRLGRLSERIARGAVITLLERTDQLMRRGENLSDRP